MKVAVSRLFLYRAREFQAEIADVLTVRAGVGSIARG